MCRDVLVEEQQNIEEIPRNDYKCLKDTKDGGQQLSNDRQVGEWHNDEDDKNVHLGDVKLLRVSLKIIMRLR